MHNIDRERKLQSSHPLCLLLEAKATVQKYSFGATYCGQTCGKKRCGVGVFSWPSGETYVGEFSDNGRNGLGWQVELAGLFVMLMLFVILKLPFVYC